MKKRIQVYYSGMVQGVGFRFTAESIAGDLEVCGWVKNLRDGRVEIVAEAEEGALKDFLGRIEQSLSHHIRDADVKWQEPTGEFNEFRIAF